jgi:SAM-dependent methyltransferase
MAKRKHSESTEKGEKKQQPKKKDDSKTKAETKDEPGSDAPWSKSKKKRMRKLMGKGQMGDVNTDKDSKEQPKLDTEKASSKKSKKKEEIEASLGRYDKGKKAGDESKSPTSSLQQSFKARLSGSRFRILNEELYTTTSSTAFDRFSSNPELYEQYHEGFRHQVEQWPVNPVTTIVNRLKSRIGNDDDKKIVVADFGCGDAELAKQLVKVQHKGKCPYKVHSFDLIASSDLVTACDMSNVPLPKNSVDVGIFCLSLMGTNMADFIREAHRVLKDDGRIHIAEVRSRFESKAGKDGKDGEGDFSEFVGVLDQLGFKCVKTDRSNKMFALLDLKKSGKAPKKDVEFTAKPCIYKRR